MMGVVGGHAITARFDGDASLRKRPMRRILDPLVLMGAEVLEEAEGGRCPILLKGTAEPVPIEYRTPVASAQIKSAVLLAGLNSPGRTMVIEPEASRDHTEKMLSYFGAAIEVETFGAAWPQDHARRPAGTCAAPDRRARRSVLGGVPSRRGDDRAGVRRRRRRRDDEPAAHGPSHHPARNGRAISRFSIGAQEGGEEVADLRVRAAGAERASTCRRARADHDRRISDPRRRRRPSPQGETRMRGLGELRVKESDRLAAIAAGLRAAGVDPEIDGDDLIVEGARRRRRRRRPRRHPSRPSHRHELSVPWASPREAGRRSTIPA